MLQLRVSVGGGDQHCAVAADSCVRQGSADADRWEGGGMTSHVFHCWIKPWLRVAFCFRSHWKIPPNPPMKPNQSLYAKKGTLPHFPQCACPSGETRRREKCTTCCRRGFCSYLGEDFFIQEVKTGCISKQGLFFLALIIWNCRSRVWNENHKSGKQVIGVFRSPSASRQTWRFISLLQREKQRPAWSLSDLSNTSSLSSAKRHRQTTRPRASVWHLALQR